jgi:hypothetical protein
VTLHPFLPNLLKYGKKISLFSTMALKKNCFKTMLIQILLRTGFFYCDPDPGAEFCLAVDAKAYPELLHDHLVEEDRVHEHEDPRASVQDHENVRELL